MENIRMVFQRLKSRDRVEAGQSFQVGRGRARSPEFPNKDKRASTTLRAMVVGEQCVNMDVELTTLTNENTPYCFTNARER